MSVLSEVPLPEAATFRLWRSGERTWSVEGPGGSCGGLFTSDEEARRFIRREARARGLAPKPLLSPHPVAGRLARIEYRLPGVRLSAWPAGRAVR
jgi:hypothetical protein